MKSRKAFTLIELLVVVAIIALLIALIMPALGRAKEEAKLVKCQANMHAIAIALASYNSSNQDFMPSIQPIYLPDWNNSGQLMGWADQMLADGDFKEHNDFQGRGGAGGDGTAADSNDSWHYPSWGYGMMQCPKHSADYQWDNSSPPVPSDARYYQGYALAWCAGSFFYNATNNGGPFSVQARQLNPTHIIAAEANGSMGNQSAYYVPAHMQKSSVAPGNFCYGVFERHLRNNTLGGNYLFADSHVEFSSDYGWAPSPVYFKSTSLTVSTSTVANPFTKSRIWVHGNADGL